ncbi:carboxymuconolactone decarboxylase family protein [Microbulbifer sp. 2205BS26-8]|uniref:carboxymuconolactone decarboxylase family protein n=1 Tax=Microbulbifer sp. 2205BS26-8 TaxID=3064386 RepID=UPI00273EBA67|nr:carboxymuconolactone decarboxylase family protein [Microbulbifer sp. 2205BS26-8]MDP5211009.1 carboxymuconolactone decarboxylase family protein [Microbulbifer sp. 2205BS26-8]
MNEHSLTDQGRKIMDQLEQGLADRVTHNLSQLDKGLSELITDYAFGKVLARPGLDLKTREMLTVASLISLGTAMPQLELHMRAALNVGVTKDELIEIVIQMAIYVGVPACMNAITVYKQVILQWESQ